MSVSLSSAALARLEAASRTFVSPLAFECVDDWRTGVMDAACDVVGAGSATFLFPGQFTFALTRGLDPVVDEAAVTFLRDVWSGTGGSIDPSLVPFHRYLVERRVEVWDMPATFDILKVDPRRQINPWRGEILIPHGMDDTNALTVPIASGSVQLSLHGFRRVPEPGGLYPVLRLLLSTLKAGLDTLARLDAHRAALDAAGEPLAAFDADGVETHRTSALTRLLADAPDGVELDAALAAFAGRIRPFAFARRHEAFGAGATTTTVRAGRSEYVFRTVLLPAGALGHGDAFVVTVEPRGLAAVLPSPETVRQRHGLTRREAEVALLVAEGLGNDRVAERLFVSSHTVRHHLENAMGKLGLTGRGREAVAARLLDGGD